ncbi:hypothetical protein M3Y97_01009400 [Aphelenchoides bicaudatus]|nr:hypothetical protein M3Y97_01009400 [Aphelenchoides bicaudatus]
MPRRADHISQLLGNRGPIPHHSGRQSIILFRAPPGSRPTSVHSRRSPHTYRIDPSRPTSISSQNPSLPASPYLPPYAADAEDIPSIDAPDMTNSAKISVVEGKDGEVELVVDNDGPVLFSLLEETDIEGVRHLTDARHSTR